MKIDMHTHCLPISRCSNDYAEDIPEAFVKKGIDAIVLTNHCYPAHLEPISMDLKEQAEIYLDVYRRCKAKGEEVGLKVFFGVELKLINEPHSPEFLLYGLSEEEFLESYPLYNMSQRELFDFCNKKDILMIQAHPFREEQGYEPGDMRYAHGVEIYNAHPYFANGFDRANPLADENGLLKTAGTDFHGKAQAGMLWTVVPDCIEDQFMLRDFIKSGKIEVVNENGVIFKQ